MCFYKNETRYIYTNTFLGLKSVLNKLKSIKEIEKQEITYLLMSIGKY